MSKQKTREIRSNVYAAISDGFAEIQELAGECEELVDGAAGTGRAETPFIQAMAENLDYLGNLDEPNMQGGEDILEFQDCQFTMIEATKSFGKVHMSREKRMQNAVNKLEAAISALEALPSTIVDELEDAGVTVDTLSGELADVVGEAGSTNWPSMRG